jgi:hypothetical protein
MSSNLQQKTESKTGRSGTGNKYQWCNKYGRESQAENGRLGRIAMTARSPSGRKTKRRGKIVRCRTKESIGSRRATKWLADEGRTRCHGIEQGRKRQVHRIKHRYRKSSATRFGLIGKLRADMGDRSWINGPQILSRKGKRNEGQTYKSHFRLWHNAMVGAFLV